MPEGIKPDEQWMRRGYQQQDAHLFDYQLYQIPGVRGAFRGPPVVGADYIACVGAAQTFGRFVQQPYPALIAGALGIESLNLGRGGAAPTFPLSSPLLLGLLNRARAVIVQVFSGRSQSNSLFQISGHGMAGINLANGREVVADEFYAWLLEQDEQLAHRVVAETRANYVQAMTELLDAITTPKILFWFSVRSPGYREQWRLPVHHLFGDFPQLVNREMVDRLRARCHRYVECVSRRGLPQLLSKPGGLAGTAFRNSLPADEAPPSVNRYYPSPEMHEDAAALLIPECRSILTHE